MLCRIFGNYITLLYICIIKPTVHVLTARERAAAMKGKRCDSISSAAKIGKISRPAKKIKDMTKREETRIQRNMAANYAKTCLGAGETIRAVLTEDDGVGSRVRGIYPIAADNTELPYITFRRTGHEQRPGYKQTPVKGRPGSDTVHIEVVCRAATYLESVDIAEAVRAALDGVQAEHGGLPIRSCTMVDSSEDREADAYIQLLVFECKT